MPKTRRIRTGSPIQRAETLLDVAGIYAGDGAIRTAIERAEEAIAILKRERDRRDTLIKQFLITGKGRMVSIPLDSLTTSTNAPVVPMKRKGGRR